MSAFKDFLKRVISILNSVDLNYVIVGGVAVIISGRPRSTTDLDLIVENDHEKIMNFFDGLKKQNFEVMDDQVKYSFKEGFNLSIFDNQSIMRIVLKIAKKSDDIDALTDSREITYENLKIKIANIEQILYGKILYIGNIKGISEKELLQYNDVQDFITIYKTHESDINHELLKNKIKKAGLTKTLEIIKKLIPDN